MFGFRVVRELPVPDGPASTLLRVSPPVGLTALYLELGGSILELLHFDRPGSPSAEERPFTEPGLTHLSFTVDDVAATCALVAELGGDGPRGDRCRRVRHHGAGPRRSGARAAPARRALSVDAALRSGPGGRA